MSSISFSHSNQAKPVLMGDYRVLPNDKIVLLDGQEPVLRGANHYHYDNNAPDDLHGRSWVRALLHNAALPCCHSSRVHSNRPVSSTALNMDFGLSLAAVSGEWWLCRASDADATLGVVHVFNQVCLIPATGEPPVRPDTFQDFFAFTELLPAASVESTLNKLMLELPALAALHHMPKAHLHVHIMADVLPVVERDTAGGARGGLGEEWDALADLLQDEVVLGAGAVVLGAV